MENTLTLKEAYVVVEKTSSHKGESVFLPMFVSNSIRTADVVKNVFAKHADSNPSGYTLKEYFTMKKENVKVSKDYRYAYLETKDWRKVDEENLKEEDKYIITEMRYKSPAEILASLNSDENQPANN